jgi:hypothetical protein
MIHTRADAVPRTTGRGPMGKSAAQWVQARISRKIVSIVSVIASRAAETFEAVNV